MRIDCKTYLEIDEIDHLTIRYRRGQGLDRKKAISLIKFYVACSAPVAEAFRGEDVTLAALGQYGDRALHDALVRVRTALIDTVL